MIQSDSMMQVSPGAALLAAPDCYCWWLWRQQLIVVLVVLVVALVLLVPPVEFGFGGMQQQRRGCPLVGIAFVAGKVVSVAQQLLASECVASADVVVDDAVAAPDVHSPVDFDCSSFVLLEPGPLLGPVGDAFLDSSLPPPFGLD